MPRRIGELGFRLNLARGAAISLALPLCAATQLPAADRRPLPEFERTVIDDDFPGAYQVEVADVNGDGRPDVVAVGGGTCAWYENPSWTKRVVTGPERSPAIISSASRDLDGDGRAEVAIAYDFAMNEPNRGKLGLAVQSDESGERWEFRPIADVPSIHRLRWGQIEPGGNPELVVAPIFGAGATPPAFEKPAELAVFELREDPVAGRWARHVVAKRPVIHAIEVKPSDGDGPATILTADNRGVSRSFAVTRDGLSLSVLWWDVVPGAEGQAPKRGASEVHLGRFADGRGFITTVEPWHGTMVVVYPGDGNGGFGPRTVVDDTLKEGHALWVADVDGDGDDEVFAGYRGEGTSVNGYDFDGEGWKKTVIDDAIAAQDLRGGDLDGDGRPDVVAVGGATHNVVWYRPKS